MPRSNALKVESLPADGVHKIIDCPFCDKMHIRSDNFYSHMETHVKKLEVTTAEEFAKKFNDVDVYIVDVDTEILVKQVVKDDNTLTPCGVCFNCKKFIKNKDPRQLSLDTFDQHQCKDKKIQQKENAKKPPKSNSDDILALYVSIKTGIKDMTEKQREMLEDCNSVEDTKADVIQQFVRKLCRVSAVSPNQMQSEISNMVPELEGKTPAYVVNYFKKIQLNLEKSNNEISEKDSKIEELEAEVKRMSLLDMERQKQIPILLTRIAAAKETVNAWRDQVNDPVWLREQLKRLDCQESTISHA
jgi:hypothetical protein